MSESVSIREAADQALALARAAMQSTEKVASDTPAVVPTSDLGSKIRKLASHLRELPHEKIASETEVSFDESDSFSDILRKTAAALREAEPVLEKNASLIDERVKSATLAMKLLQEPTQ